MISLTDYVQTGPVFAVARGVTNEVIKTVNEQLHSSLCLPFLLYARARPALVDLPLIRLLPLPPSQTTSPTNPPMRTPTAVARRPSPRAVLRRKRSSWMRRRARGRGSRGSSEEYRAGAERREEDGGKVPRLACVKFLSLSFSVDLRGDVRVHCSASVVLRLLPREKKTGVNLTWRGFFERRRRRLSSHSTPAHLSEMVRSVRTAHGRTTD